jgi:hypothetical protein
MKIPYLILLILFFLILSKQVDAAQNLGILQRAGLRSSVYGFDNFPDTTWWLNSTKDMALKFTNSQPSVVWILGYTTENGCYLNFPNPNPNISYSNIYFSNKDENEKYLNYFDKSGIKVWLQVEPGFADVMTLIDLALTKYKKHESIIGFGIDVEWYKTSSANNYEGQSITDSEAEQWITKIKSFNTDYLLFTKHWLSEKMPPSFRSDIVFIDDSQNFSNMTSMINEFSDWSKTFSESKVAFQFGYEADKSWWKNLSDPPKVIGDELLKKCSNISDLYWVDFTAYDIWPADFNPTRVPSSKNIGNKIQLFQNYPNPFNPSTTIEYSIPYQSIVKLYVYDMLGQMIIKLVNEVKEAGNYKIDFNRMSLSSGTYFFQLKANNFIETRKFIITK